MTIPWAEVAAAAGALLGLGGVAGGVWKYGLKPGIALGRLAFGIGKRISVALDRIEVLWVQWTPNGGKSAIDRIARIEERGIIQGQIIQALAITLPVGTWRSRADGSVSEVNRRTQWIVSRTSDELLGTSWVTWVYEDDRESFLETFRDAVSNAREFDSTCRMVRPDGLLQRVRSRGAPLHGADQKYAGHFGTVEALGLPYREGEEPPAHGRELDMTGGWVRPGGDTRP